jgi:hypothetical protein
LEQHYCLGLHYVAVSEVKGWNSALAAFGAVVEFEERLWSETFPRQRKPDSLGRNPRLAILCAERDTQATRAACEEDIGHERETFSVRLPIPREISSGRRDPERHSPR